jgi:thiamine kinase-like enzyme
MPRLEPDWVSSLKQALDKVAELPEWRRTVDANELASTIRRRFGIRAASRADEWRPAHGDLHWSNLTAPACMLLDWEDWGTAPRAYDVATLLSYSFGNPTLFRRIEKEFAKELDTQSGIVARLYRYALHLDAVENGISDPREYPLIEVETKRLLRL